MVNIEKHILNVIKHKIEILTEEEFNLALDPLLPKGYLSASQVNKYGSCPKDYFFAYVLEKAFIRNERMVLGSATHKLIENAINAQLASKSMPKMEEILDDSTSICEDMYFNEEEEPTSDGMGLGGIIDAAQKSFIVWYKNRMPSISPVASEKKVLMLLNDIPVKGYIDYINLTPEGLEIRDIKVSKKKRDPENSLQLAAYALAEGTRLVGFDTILQPTKRLDTRLEVSGASLSQDYLDHTASIITNTYRGITQGFFPECLPDHWLCSDKWCSNFSVCRKG